MSKFLPLFMLLTACGINFSPEDGETMKCYADLWCDDVLEQPFERTCSTYEDLPELTKDYRRRVIEEASTRCAEVRITMLNCETDSKYGPNGVGRSCDLPTEAP